MSAAAPAEDHAGSGLPTGWAAGLGARLLAERERWPLWAPVLLGLGVAGYFWSPMEPAPWAAALPALPLAGLAWLLRRHPGRCLVALLLLALVAGFGLAQLRSWLVAAPVLERNWGPARLTAAVLAGEPQTRGWRLYLQPLDMPGLEADRLPAKLRVTVGALGEAPPPGSRISLRAALRPPSPPAAPGAFDFARRAWFQQIGGLGFAYGGIRIEAAPETAPGLREGWSLWWAEARQTIATRIAQRIEGQEGAVAVALITGLRGGISEETREDMRAAGLAHLLAISGLHMGLVAGLLFFALRAGFALVPGLALRQPIKKWAALGAGAGAFVYLNLVGASIPAQRAFLMVAIVLLAVLLDRRALSLRLVAWAAVVILILAPESLMSASFQMSFAAVTALIAAYEFWERRRPWMETGEGPRGPLRRLADYFAGVALSSVIAILATSPFAAFHFHRLALYGLLANLIAVPLTAFWIMPWAVFALILMPFGWEGLALTPMAWGLEVLLGVAAAVADWPAAILRVPPMPDWGLGLVVLAGLWLCLWQGRWRFWALPVIALGAFSPVTFQPPDLLVSGDGRLAAIRDGVGRLFVPSQRGSRFVLQSWERQVFAAETVTWPKLGEAAEGALSCDPLACLYRSDKGQAAILLDPRAAGEDCARAEVVVSLEPLRRQPCREPDVVLDRFDLWREGAHAIWLGAKGPEVATVAGQQGVRPWSPYPARRAPWEE